MIKWRIENHNANRTFFFIYLFDWTVISIENEEKNSIEMFWTEGDLILPIPFAVTDLFFSGRRISNERDLNVLCDNKIDSCAEFDTIFNFNPRIRVETNNNNKSVSIRQCDGKRILHSSTISQCNQTQTIRKSIVH